MRFDFIDWDDEDDAQGNVRHIAEHGLTPDEVEDVLDDPDASGGISRSTGRPIVWGWSFTGKHILVVFDILEDDPLVIRPVTAYEIPED